MKKKTSVLFALTALICITACGDKQLNVDNNTVMVDKKGIVSQAIVEDFNQPYYSADELKSDIESMISAYNSKASSEEAVVLDRFELSDDKVVRVYINYQTSQDYYNFNEKELFAGTVSDAHSEGYQFPDLKGANGEEDISSTEVLEKGDMGVLILVEGQQIKTPGKICYVSEGVSIIDEKTAVNLNDGQKSYIVYKKK